MIEEHSVSSERHVSSPHSDLLTTIREESALLADWAEEGGCSSVDADAIRSRLMDAAENLVEQLEALRNCVEEYADLDNWEAVRSPETTSAWQKRWGHPTPWVDAQEALEVVSNPAERR